MFDAQERKGQEGAKMVRWSWPEVPRSVRSIPSSQNQIAWRSFGSWRRTETQSLLWLVQRSWMCLLAPLTSGKKSPRRLPSLRLKKLTFRDKRLVRKAVFRKRSRPDWEDFESTLEGRMRAHRKDGHRIGTVWISRRAKEILAERAFAGRKPLDWRGKRFQGSRRWAAAFAARVGSAMRKVTCKRKDKPEEAVKQIMRIWHLYFRELVLRKPEHVNLPPQLGEDPKWGTYPPSCRFNCDTTGIDAFLLPGTTYASREERKSGCIQVPNPGTHGGKRLASLNLTLCGDVEELLLRPLLIFKGAGRVYEQEVQHYHKQVRVMFQKNAWLDAQDNISFFFSWVSWRFPL